MCSVSGPPWFFREIKGVIIPISLCQEWLYDTPVKDRLENDVK